jgi:hypothetical protein
MAHVQNVYEQVLEVCTDYLGPAGERFMRRQIATHLNKQPEQLSRKDLPELANWLRLTFAMLTDEAQLIDDFSTRLKALSRATPPSRRKSGDQ